MCLLFCIFSSLVLSFCNFCHLSCCLLLFCHFVVCCVVVCYFAICCFVFCLVLSCNLFLVDMIIFCHILCLISCYCCHFDFYLILDKCLNFFSRTLESALDPALDVDKTGEVLALVQVSPISVCFIFRKTFAVRRALNPFALTFPFETNLMVMYFFLDL